jgi:hypothetical protein
MRKRILGETTAAQETRSEEQWLSPERIAEVEVTSEDSGFPIESALKLEGASEGWRAAQPGEQLVRIVFDAPIAVRKIRLQFREADATRTQEFVLRWASSRNEPLREIVRQQWTFSPGGSTSEVEDYQVNLRDVGVLELAVKPDIGGGNTRASLLAWRLA